MKTLLIALNSKFVHSNLALRYLYGYAGGYGMEIFEGTINENIIDTAYRIAEYKADIFALSCYIWNRKAVTDLISILKAMNPKAFIVVGGPEASNSYEELMSENAQIDVVIRGEGELVFKNLIEALNEGSDYKSIKGIVYREEGNIIPNHEEELIKDLDTLPFPYERDIPEGILYYESSRGCPFNCSYCLSSTIKGVRYLSLDKVKKELRILIEKGVPLVKFVDRTFNSNKMHAMEIWKFIIENSKNTAFHFEIAADLLDGDMIELLRGAPKGLIQFEIGVQTTNGTVLKNINRIMDFKKVSDNIKRLRETSFVHFHLDLIAGLPGENMESFRKSFEDCMELRPDVLQLGFLKVLNGSPICGDKEKYGLVHANFPPYQIVSTLDMEADDIGEIHSMERIFESFYNSGIFSCTMDTVLSMEKSKYSFFSRLTEYFKEKELIYRNLSLQDRFMHLYHFLINYYGEEKIRDIMLYDYIINTKKASTPVFLRREEDKHIRNYINDHTDEIKKRFNIKEIKDIAVFKTTYQVVNEGRSYKVINRPAASIYNVRIGSMYYDENI